MRGGTSFSYIFDNVPDGDYEITLYFAEPFFTSAGERQIDVTVEGVLTLDNLDVAAVSGGSYVAHTETSTTTVTDGQLNIDFDAVTNRLAIVSAIAVRGI